MKIQSLTFLNRAKAKSFLASVLDTRPASGTQSFDSLLFSLSKRMLGDMPVKWFVSVADTERPRKDILGLLALQQDLTQKQRWHIVGVWVDPNASTFEVASRLVQHVVAELSNQQVEIFVASVDHQNTDLLGVYQMCGFRHGFNREEYLLKVTPDNSTDIHHQIEACQEFIQDEWIVRPPSDGQDWDRIEHLIEGLFPPDAKLAIRQGKAHYFPTWLQQMQSRMQSQYSRSWLVLQEVSMSHHLATLALIQMETKDFKRFELSILNNPMYANQTSPMVHLAIQQVLKNATSPEIYLQVFDFQKPLLEGLSKRSWLPFEWQGTDSILLKECAARVKEWQTDLPAQGLQILSPSGGKASPACSKTV